MYTHKQAVWELHLWTLHFRMLFRVINDQFIKQLQTSIVSKWASTHKCMHELIKYSMRGTLSSFKFFLCCYVFNKIILGSTNNPLLLFINLTLVFWLELQSQLGYLVMNSLRTESISYASYILTLVTIKLSDTTLLILRISKYLFK